MTSTTPKLLSPFTNFLTTPTGGCLTLYVSFSVQRWHGESLVESGFEPETHRLRGRHITTRPSQPFVMPDSSKKIETSHLYCRGLAGDSIADWLGRCSSMPRDSGSSRWTFMFTIIISII
ncbi:hypothetical protein AVEN_266585-1 [Araneus ventricosus]|uniref:Uncharacterized protein n=1 Tax=Araneus ventricosus TaxID=182803 RepID=A0A4Y2U0L8_ARAVE|nr:hypothetical protein AVEN_75701-1 [Araneus ventricosus]GBO02066.1 hypothetical protein AVEN_266616-1 [Araneus ventricosus]GBO05601.1 hypothetical protein AVEN_224417-1 [Araneus ventricosus]GBO05602.1 hypothetical protein AVEN_266585-1 [Araneus ventricosus]